MAALAPAKFAPASRSLPSRRSRYAHWAYVAPALIPLALLSIVPTVLLYWVSLTNYDMGTDLSRARFVGLDNYVRLFSGSDTEFFDSVVVTIKFAVLATLAELSLGMVMAVLLHSVRRLQGVLISWVMLPMVVTPVVAGLVWKLMFNSENGVIDWSLRGTLGIAPNWLGADLSFLSVLLVEIWQWTPFVGLILLSGLAGLPAEPLEASAIDGASRWQTFRYVIVPLLKPVIGLCILFRVVDVIKIFDIIFVMTGGGPGATTESLGIHAYRLGFFWAGWVGRASATAVVLSIVALIATTFMVRWLQKLYREKH
jgi:multiple sugar transport system permease protein